MRSGVRHCRNCAYRRRSGRRNGVPGHINPDECIDCGNCAELCAQGAIFPADELPADKAHFAAKNQAYFN